MSNTPIHVGLAQAAMQASRVRRLYHQLEEVHHGTRWSKQEDVVGLQSDVGELGRLVMGAEGRWMAPDDVRNQLEVKLAECLWWVFSLSNRLGIDIEHAFVDKMTELEHELALSVANSRKQKKTAKRKAKNPAPKIEGAAGNGNTAA